VVPAAPEKKKANKKATATAKGLAGAISGGVETMCVWPLESIKTRLQLTRRAAKAGGQPPPFTGMVSCFRYTVKTTGFLSLYHGMAPVLVGSIPKAGFRFGVFERLNQLFVKPDGTTNALRTLVAGTSAGALESLVVVTPVETIKTKLIDLKMGAVPGTLHIFKTEGLRGMYKGAVATTLKQGSNQGLRFMAFEQYRKWMTQGPDSKKVSLDPLQAMFGGMCAGMFSTLLNNPFDVLKTRMQGTEATRLYSGFVDCTLKIAKSEGVSTFWSGVVPRLARVVPGQGIIFASSETITQWVTNYGF
jgi:solute carrier family 25 citrate transporter 1